MSRFRGVMRRYSPIFLIPIKVSDLLFLGPTIATTTSLVVDGDEDAEHDEDDDADDETDNETGGRSSSRISCHVNWIRGGSCLLINGRSPLSPSSARPLGSDLETVLGLFGQTINDDLLVPGGDGPVPAADLIVLVAPHKVPHLIHFNLNVGIQGRSPTKFYAVRTNITDIESCDRAGVV